MPARKLSAADQLRREWVMDREHLTLLARLRKRRRAQRLVTLRGWR